MSDYRFEARPVTNTNATLLLDGSSARSTSSEKCVELRGQSEVDNDQMWYRICKYQQMRLYGDSSTDQDLHNRHVFLSARELGLSDWRPRRCVGPDFHADLNIPEPALWSFFNDLVEACLVLRLAA